MRTLFTRLAIGVSAMFLLAGSGLAGEKKLMHCFYFTPVQTATQADWQAFYAATDALPKEIPGVNRVWYGKLARPMRLSTANGERVVREFGVCMEMADEAALKTYAAHPAHQKWNEAYSKVRVSPTTTVDILGQ